MTCGTTGESSTNLLISGCNIWGASRNLRPRLEFQNDQANIPVLVSITTFILALHQEQHHASSRQHTRQLPLLVHFPKDPALRFMYGAT
jgi:hypothetical protein